MEIDSLLVMIMIMQYYIHRASGYCFRRFVLNRAVLDVSDLALLETETSTFCILAELGLSFLYFEHDDSVGLATRSDLEEPVHRLKRNRLGLGDEEPHKDNGKQHHAGEEEVDTTA
jgi:hypothetical protein